MSNRLRVVTSSSLASLAAATLVSLAAADEQTTRYEVTEITGLPASNVCPCFWGEGINDAGQVTGRFFAPDGELHGFLWTDGVMVDLGSLGGDQTVPQGLDPAGGVVGWSDTGGEPQRAFHYLDGVITDLGTLGGLHSAARGSNGLGVVVGNAQRSGDNYSQAFRWEDGTMVNLGVIDDAPFSDALAVNAAGDIVGWSWNAAWDAHAVIWPAAGGGPIDLGVLGDVTNHSHAMDIDGLGRIVGSSETGEHDPTPIRHAILWENGRMIDLGLLPEAGEGISFYFAPAHTSTAAHAINDAGQIVGNSLPAAAEPETRFGPFLHEDGEMLNLNDLLTSEAAGAWHVIEVQDISNTGVIVGTARLGDPASTTSRAVILTPVPVPLGDVNGDFTVDVQDLLRLLADWGDCLGCLSDLDDDDEVTIADLLMLLANWS